MITSYQLDVQRQAFRRLQGLTRGRMLTRQERSKLDKAYRDLQFAEELLRCSNGPILISSPPRVDLLVQEMAAKILRRGGRWVVIRWIREQC